MALELTTREARLLLEIAFLAMGHNRFGAAARILAGLERFRPGEESVDCGAALLALSQGDADLALRFLDGQALPRHPDSAMLKFFKCLALVELKERSRADTILQELQDCPDANVAEMARKLLAERR